MNIVYIFVNGTGFESLAIYICCIYRYELENVIKLALIKGFEMPIDLIYNIRYEFRYMNFRHRKILSFLYKLVYTD